MRMLAGMKTQAIIEGGLLTAGALSAALGMPANAQPAAPAQPEQTAAIQAEPYSYTAPPSQVAVQALEALLGKTHCYPWEQNNAPGDPDNFCPTATTGRPAGGEAPAAQPAHTPDPQPSPEAGSTAAMSGAAYLGGCVLVAGGFVLVGTVAAVGSYHRAHDAR